MSDGWEWVQLGWWGSRSSQELGSEKVGFSVCPPGCEGRAGSPSTVARG